MKIVLITVTFNFFKLCNREEYYETIAKSFIVIFHRSKTKKTIKFRGSIKELFRSVLLWTNKKVSFSSHNTHRIRSRKWKRRKIVENKAKNKTFFCCFFLFKEKQTMKMEWFPFNVHFPFTNVFQKHEKDFFFSQKFHRTFMRSVHILTVCLKIWWFLLLKLQFFNFLNIFKNSINNFKKMRLD